MLSSSENPAGLQAGDSQSPHSERPILLSPAEAKLPSELHQHLRKAWTHTALSPRASALLSSPSLKALSLDSLSPKQVAGGLTSETLLQHRVAEPSRLSMAATTVRRVQAGTDRTLGLGPSPLDFWPLPPILGQMWRLT